MLVMVAILVDEAYHKTRFRKRTI